MHQEEIKGSALTRFQKDISGAVMLVHGLTYEPTQIITVYSKTTNKIRSKNNPYRCPSFCNEGHYHISLGLVEYFSFSMPSTVLVIRSIFYRRKIFPLSLLIEIISPPFVSQSDNMLVSHGQRTVLWCTVPKEDEERTGMEYHRWVI